MPITVRDNIYSDIESQFPNVYRENSDFFIAFVEAYYQYLDQKNDRDIPKLRDIDTTLPAFFVYYKKKYLADLPIHTTIDVPFIVKHIDDLYTRKGTKESLELLFKMFFNEDISVFYPGGHILKPSNSIWGNEKFLEMKTIFNVDGYPIQRGNTIKGDLSNAEAFVDDIVFVSFSGALTPILFMSNLRGTFGADDSLEVISATNDGTETVINVGKLIAGSIVDVEVSKAVRLPNQVEGDSVEFVSRKSGVGGKGIIIKSSLAQVGSIDYEILDGGFGYLKPGTFDATAEYLNEVEISNQVIILKGDTPYNIEKGDTITFPGSTVEYTGRDVPLAQQYSVNGSGVVTEYRHPLLFIESKTTKEQLFEAFTEYYPTIDGSGNEVYRNVLYDSFLNSFWFKLGTPANMVNLPASYDKYYKFMQQPAEPQDKYQTTYAQFIGPENSMNNINTTAGAFNLSEPPFFLGYQTAINNGIDDVELYDSITDFDDWVNSGADFGEIDLNVLQAEAVDRIPTISPTLTPFLNTVGLDVGGLEELHDGQIYTIVNRGQSMTDDDFIKIGCTNPVTGADFRFTNANLANLSKGGFNLERYDAEFTAAKQIYSKLLKFFQLTGLYPNITIGTTFQAPPNYPELVSASFPANDANGQAIAIGEPHPLAGTPNYTFYSQYFVPADKLVPGREYIIRDFGTTSYADWNLLGAQLDTKTLPAVIYDLPVATAGNIQPLNEYFIETVGSTTPAQWTSLGWVANQNGAGDEPAEGDRFVGVDYTYSTYTINATGTSGGNWVIASSTDSGGSVSGNSPTITLDVGDTVIFNNADHPDTLLNILSTSYNQKTISNISIGSATSASLNQFNISGHGFANKDIVRAAISDGTYADLTPSTDYFVKSTNNGDSFKLYTQLTASGGFDEQYVVIIDQNNLNAATGVQVQFTRLAIGQTEGVSGLGTDTITFQPTEPGTYFYADTINTSTDGNILVSTKTPTADMPTVAGSGKVVDITEHNKSTVTSQLKFTALQLANDVTVSGTGYCIDFANTITQGTYTGYGVYTDPLRDANNNQVNVLPDSLQATSFLGFINGDWFDTIECSGIGPYNASSSFDITEVVDTEVVTLTTDIIGDHFKEVLEPRIFLTGLSVNTSTGLFTHTEQTIVEKKYVWVEGSTPLGGVTNGDNYFLKPLSTTTFELYLNRTGTLNSYVYTNKVIPTDTNVTGHAIKRTLGANEIIEYEDFTYETSGNLGPENINTQYGDAFAEQTFTIGSINSILEDKPGINYQNDVGVRVLNNVVAQYDLRDLIITFDDAPFTLQKNDIVTQKIRSPYEGPATDTEADYIKGALQSDNTNSVLFDRSITVNGLEIVASTAIGGQPAVTDAFALKVARMMELLVDPNGTGVNKDAQRKLIGVLRGDTDTPHEGVPTAQRVAYGSGGAYTPNFLTDSGAVQYTGYNTFLLNHETNDMIWYKPTGGPNPGIGDRDIEEVLEHLLHTIHLYGIPGTVENSEVEMNWIAQGNTDWETTELHLAMKEAIDATMFNPSSYAPLWQTSQADAEIAYKEYLYFLNWGMWSMSEFWSGGSKAPEWNDNMRTPSGIQSNNPLGYALFNDYIAPVLSSPNFVTLRSIFQDNDAGVSGYVPTPETSYLSASEARTLAVSSTTSSIASYFQSIGNTDTPAQYTQSVTTFDLIEEKYDVRLKFLKRSGTEFYFRPVSFFGVEKDQPVTVRSEEKNILTVRKDPDSLPMGANAEILGAAEYSTGQLEEVKVLHTGYKYEDGEEIDIVNVTEASPTYNQTVATATLKTTGQGGTEGRWKDQTSFLNDTSARIHDNDYYQEYSYDISTMIDPELYTPLVKDVVGVAGTKMFNTPLINSDNSFESDIDVSIRTFDVIITPFEAEGTGFTGNVSASLEDEEITTESGEVLTSVTQEEDDRVV